MNLCFDISFRESVRLSRKIRLQKAILLFLLDIFYHKKKKNSSIFPFFLKYLYNFTNTRKNHIVICRLL